MTLLRGKQGSKALMKAFNNLAKRQVLVGFPAGEAPRKDGELSNAAIGYIQNYGAPEANIPARPFMEPGIRQAQDKIQAQLKKAAAAVLRGNDAGVQSGLETAGTVAVASIQNTIEDVIPPPLAPETLAERKRKGFKGETPLLRTGQLRSAVTWVVEREGR